MRVSRLGPEAVPDVVVPDDYVVEATALILLLACFGLVALYAFHTFGSRG